MRVSVIVAMPARRSLRILSANAFGSTSMRAGIAEPTRRGGLLLDPAFPLLPLAARSAEAIDLKAANAERAPSFVARGTIDVDGIGEVEAEQGGVRIFADPEIGLFQPYCGHAPIGTHLDVAQLLDVAALKARKLDGKGAAVAIMDTGINLKHLRGTGPKPKLDKTTFWAPPGVAPTPGAYPVDHGTMCAFGALIAAPGCTLLDFPILRSTTPGGSAMAGFLSDALLAYSYLQRRMTTPAWKYRALVISNSWGMYHPSWDFPAGHPGRYADNPDHPFNIMVGTLARAGADILFAAGNCGSDCPDGRCQKVTKHTIAGANAHPDVLTVAGCDISDQRVGYSSQGPAIPGMGSRKPDVTAYTHFLGSEAFGAGEADSGTSTACPVAAGCVAALRTRLPPGKAPPKGLFEQFRFHAAARPGSEPGWNADYGAGILRPVPVATHFKL